jgi:cytochrome P450
MVIQIPVHTINHDPEYWDNPEMFIPERLAKKPLLKNICVFLRHSLKVNSLEEKLSNS